MKERKLHIGDVIENHYASTNNPHMIGFIAGIDAVFVYMKTPCGGKFSSYRFYKDDVIKETDTFKLIGHIDIVKYVKDELSKLKS